MSQDLHLAESLGKSFTFGLVLCTHIVGGGGGGENGWGFD